MRKKKRGRSIEGIVLLACIAVLVAAGAGLTFVQEGLFAFGTTLLYEQDVALNTGSETLVLYNECGTTEYGKAIIADWPSGSPGSRMSITEKASLVPNCPTATPTPTPKPHPTATPTKTPYHEPTPTKTPKPEPTATKTPTPRPTKTPTPRPTPTPTRTPCGCTDPYMFEGIQWGPDSQVVLNKEMYYDGTGHQIYLQSQGYGAWAIEAQGDSAIESLANKQFAPTGQQFLPVPKLTPPAWPGSPPRPIDP